MGSRRADTLRAAMEGDGFSAEEIADTLAEIEEEEGRRDPLGRAKAAGIPRLYLEVPWEEIEMDGRRGAIEAARRWAVAHSAGPRGDAPAGLYLWSDGDRDEDETGFGTGKTWIAAAAAHHLLRHGWSVRWLTVTRLMTNLNLSFRNPMYEEAANKLREPRTNEAIVLDDIDKQPPTDHNIQPIFALITDCTNNGVPLIITANRHADDLQADWGDRFGHAAASRIVGHCLDAEVGGPDRRLRG